MKLTTKREKVTVQIMLGTSLALGVIPPLIMFFVTRKKNGYYREACRKALNFHLTIFPFFLTSSFLPQWFKYTFLIIETLIIMYAIISIALQKSYHYPAIPYIKNKEIQRNEAL